MEAKKVKGVASVKNGWAVGFGFSRFKIGDIVSMGEEKFLVAVVFTDSLMKIKRLSKNGSIIAKGYFNPN